MHYSAASSSAARGSAASAATASSYHCLGFSVIKRCRHAPVPEDGVDVVKLPHEKESEDSMQQS
jgi:hypothetical protein